MTFVAFPSCNFVSFVVNRRPGLRKWLASVRGIFTAIDREQMFAKFVSASRVTFVGFPSCNFVPFVVNRQPGFRKCLASVRMSQQRNPSPDHQTKG